MIKQLKPDIKFIIVGDFQQLPVVCDRIENVDYKSSIALNELCDEYRIKLSKCRRSDDIMFKKCNFKTINRINTLEFGKKFCNKHISYTHKKRIEINNILMSKRKEEIENKNRKNKEELSKGYITLSKIETDSHSQDVILYKDLPIIAHVTNEKYGIVNNEEFIIEKIKNFMITVKNDAGIKQIPLEEFQKLFYAAYCITIHASQGCTFDYEYTINEWSRLNKNAKYVALTRSSKLEYINII
jgi:ATP-dependent exoDNAse (exonuclease V) alpha subunit